VPKRLKEEERRKLARYFAISETLLGGPAEEPRVTEGLISIKRHPVFASAGLFHQGRSISQRATRH